MTEVFFLRAGTRSERVFLLLSFPIQLIDKPRRQGNETEGFEMEKKDGNERVGPK